MGAQDIDKIANLVVKALAASPEAGLLGRGSMSSTAAYTAGCTWKSPYKCGAGGYGCGVAALFSCEHFYCGSRWDSAVFMCDDAFTCVDMFHCFGTPGGSHAFTPPMY